MLIKAELATESWDAEDGVGVEERVVGVLDAFERLEIGGGS